MIKYNNVQTFLFLSVQIRFWVTVGLSLNHVFNLNEAHTVHSPNNNRPEEVSRCITDKCEVWGIKVSWRTTAAWPVLYFAKCGVSNP